MKKTFKDWIKYYRLKTLNEKLKYLDKINLSKPLIRNFIESDLIQ